MVISFLVTSIRIVVMIEALLGVLMVGAFITVLFAKGKTQ